MKAAFTQEMREIDRRAVEEAGMPALLLMENAGRAVAQEVMAFLGECPAGAKICVFAGKGNNGGDAFVAARHLANSGFAVRVMLFSETAEFTPDAALNFNILKNMGVQLLFVKDETDWDRALVHVMYADLLVDGLLGTGLRGAPEAGVARAIKFINRSGKKVLSIDVPSGVNGDSGAVGGEAVNADRTVALCLPKVGLLLSPGNAYAGKVIVAPIGLPRNILAGACIQQTVITKELATALLPQRRRDAHKGEAKTAVLAGALSTSGAAALCSEAALRAGAGLVRLFTPQSVSGLLAAKLTEVMVEGCPETEDGLEAGHMEYIAGQLGVYHSLAAGPGLGTSAGTVEAVCRLLPLVDCPVVVDADGLNALSGCTEVLAKTRKLAVVTPHIGEMARLTGLAVDEIKKEGVVRIARRFAGQWGAVVVLKGAPTVVALPSGEVFINSSGNPGMATAGMGDVLTGVVAGFLAQGLDAGAAAVVAVYLCGLAGDIIAENGMIGMAAGDVAAALPLARKLLTN